MNLVKAMGREPSLLADLPRWVAGASIRKEPLRHRRPWWHPRVISFVEERMPPSPRVFEYGSGASTLWFVDMRANLTTVEHDVGWLDELRRHAPTVDFRHQPNSSDTRILAELPLAGYAETISAEPNESIDLVVVDGPARRDCCLAAGPKVRPGGMLLLDDSQFHDLLPVDRANRNRLRPCFAELPKYFAGWEMHHLRGLKPGTWLPVQTTVWIKPQRVQPSHRN